MAAVWAWWWMVARRGSSSRKRTFSLISIGGAASNAFVGPFADATDIVKLAAGEMLLITNLGAGWTVTASTGDILKVANSGAAQGSYKIVLIGVG